MNSSPDNPAAPDSALSIVRVYGDSPNLRPCAAPNRIAGPDPWVALQRHTPARIGIGRSGGSQRTASLLDFRLAHARARDAVHAPFNPDAIEADLSARNFGHVRLSTRVADKQDYLLHPENGRHLSDESAAELSRLAPQWGSRDLAIVISDGLSAFAAEAHAVNVAELLREKLGPSWSLYPVFVVPFARVKSSDFIGGILKARIAIILLGERPGLGSPDSLSAYFTFNPAPERVDADRNCVSNIRPLGMPVPAAVDKLVTLLNRSRQLCIGGTALKDDSE